MRQAEAGSRVELYEAQISKMQLALERADQENSRLEQELRALTESSTKGREERQLTGLAGLRDRMRSISLLTGGSALEQQASERLQVLLIHMLLLYKYLRSCLVGLQTMAAHEVITHLHVTSCKHGEVSPLLALVTVSNSMHARLRPSMVAGLRTKAYWRVSLHVVVLQDAGEKLKSVQHERAALQKQRDALARQLAHIGEKISSGIIPDASELAVPEHIAAAAEASASAVGHFAL